MKLNKTTLIPLAVTAAVTLGLLAAINNIKALEPAKEAISGNTGWF
ncbi:hypothetical protein [Vibrio cortegadensis]